MRTILKNRKNYVLSFRVNEGEWRELQDVSRNTGRNVSTLLRQSLTAVIKEAQPGKESSCS
jgi:predicted DNA-binding protein